jgi:TetR/AcrR family transcriptional regulator
LTADRRRKPNGKRGTRDRILRAAIREFALQGYRGGRVQRIAADAGVNLRMIYHYFGSKDKLYVATLESVYLEVRRAEQQPELSALPPQEAMGRLIDFTFDHLAGHPEFIGLTTSENQLGARYLRRSPLIPSLTPALVTVIGDLLRRGSRAGAFRDDVDPVQFYISLHALCHLHLANQHTLRTIFPAMTASGWLAKRRRHVRDVLFGYLRPYKR